MLKFWENLAGPCPYLPTHLPTYLPPTYLPYLWETKKERGEVLYCTN